MKVYVDASLKRICVMNSEDRLLKYIPAPKGNTHNQNEHLAIQCALIILEDLEIYSDSQLAVRQLSGEYKVKNYALGQIIGKTREVLRGRDMLRYKTEIHWIPREENLAGIYLDKHKE